MSDHEGLVEDVLAQVKALEAAGQSDLLEAEQRLRAHLEKAVARIGELETKVARMAEVEAKLLRVAELEAKVARIGEIENRIARIRELEQKMDYTVSAMRHLKFVVEPLLQNWDTFFGSAPAPLQVNLASFRNALTALQTDINHFMS